MSEEPVNIENSLISNKSVSDPDLIKVIEYRSFELPIYFDSSLCEYYTFYKYEKINLGKNNHSYENILFSLIDEDLDVIAVGANNRFKIKWFQNGNHRDIGAFINNRLVRIYLNTNADKLHDLSEDTINYLMADTEKFIDNYNIDRD